MYISHSRHVMVLHSKNSLNRYTSRFVNSISCRTCGSTTKRLWHFQVQIKNEICHGEMDLDIRVHDP